LIAEMRALRNRVMLTVARAVVSLVDDGKKMQTLQLQLLKREIREEVERFQNYGFTAKPFPGAEGVVVFVGGNRDHGLCIAVDDRRYRLKGLQDGEVAVYTDEGDKIHFKRNRVIEVTTQTFRVNAGTKVEINTPQFELNATTEAKVTSNVVTITAPNTNVSGNVTAAGNVSDNKGSMQEMRDDYNGHAHPAGVVTPQMT
jgi:phage baseplate assembly protein V